MRCDLVKRKNQNRSKDDLDVLFIVSDSDVLLNGGVQMQKNKTRLRFNVMRKFTGT